MGFRYLDFHYQYQQEKSCIYRISLSDIQLSILEGEKLYICDFVIQIPIVYTSMEESHIYRISLSDLLLSITAGRKLYKQRSSDLHTIFRVNVVPMQQLPQAGTFRAAGTWMPYYGILCTVASDEQRKRACDGIILFPQRPCSFTTPTQTKEEFRNGICTKRRVLTQDHI